MRTQIARSTPSENRQARIANRLGCAELLHKMPLIKGLHPEFRWRTSSTLSPNRAAIAPGFNPSTSIIKRSLRSVESRRSSALRTRVTRSADSALSTPFVTLRRARSPRRYVTASVRTFEPRALAWARSWAWCEKRLMRRRGTRCAHSSRWPSHPGCQRREHDFSIERARSPGGSHPWARSGRWRECKELARI